MLPALLLCMLPGVLPAQQVKAVDLGLSVRWANMNVGADSPEDYGDYFAWGEVTAKRYYGKYSAYKHFDNLRLRKYNYLKSRGSDGLTILQLSDDAATKRMGKGWRMPTEEEMNELLDTARCIITPATSNGTRGIWVKNRVAGGDSLFLPMAGYRDYGTYRFFPGTQCYYWTSTLAVPSDTLPQARRDSLAADMVRTAKCLIYTGSEVPGIGTLDRRNGCVIRAVRSR